MLPDPMPEFGVAGVHCSCQMSALHWKRDGIASTSSVLCQHNVEKDVSHILLISSTLIS